jgi:RecA-family ATPase
MEKIAGPDKGVTIPDDLPLLYEIAVPLGVRLIIVDPVTPFLGVSAHREQFVRKAMERLKTFAEHNNVAIVLVRHLSKSGVRNTFIAA